MVQGKRPYHTIIPCMVTTADTGELFATMTNMVRLLGAILQACRNVVNLSRKRVYGRETYDRPQTEGVRLIVSISVRAQCCIRKVGIEPEVPVNVCDLMYVSNHRRVVDASYSGQ